MRILHPGITAACVLAGLAAAPMASRPAYADGRMVAWPVYGGDAASDRYAPLRQITPKNVNDLIQVWRVDAGPGGLQTNPIVVGRTLYAYSTSQQVMALDAATGARVWTFDSGVEGTQPARGLAYWSDGASKRIFAGVMDRLYALDADTGRPDPAFGEQGSIDLRAGLGGDPTRYAVALTSPGIVYKDLIIVGFRTGETKPAAPGVVRAYDVRTGKLRWTFNTIPQAGEPGAETWPAGAQADAGGANTWAGFALDEARGIVYAPTGSAATDFYGADRHGDNLFANSLIALDATTGRRLWHFQIVHHDIWDRDLPSPPALLTVRRQGKTVDAVAQTTKHGLLFLFDRVTGEPLFPIEERPVPASDTPGEAAAATQPFPVLPAPFARQHATAGMLSTRTPEVAAWAKARFATFRNLGPFAPLGVGNQTVVFPAFDGGAEWGGPAVDRKTGVIYVNANDILATGGLIGVSDLAGAGLGAQLYQSQCAGCHGEDRKGAPPAFPSLTDLDEHMSDADIARTVQRGRGRMPGFKIVGKDMEALVAYVRTGATAPSTATRDGTPPSAGAAPARYRSGGYNRFYDQDGYPAVAPPWGTLNAIDLNTGRYLWKVPLGEYPALARQGAPATGTENYGGPIVTAGGLVFIGATIFDRKLRAFDGRTGKIVWQADLPFAGVATPATYMIDGRQYVVIATSGQRDRNGPQGSAYVAFALPARR